MDTIQQVVPVLPPKDSIKKETKNIPINNTKLKVKKETPTTTSSYKPSTNTSSFNEVPVQTPTRVESVTPNSSQILYQSNGIILNRDMSCIIKGEGGTYRRNRETKEWIEFICITNHKEYPVFYYKSTNTLKIENKN